MQTKIPFSALPKFKTKTVFMLLLAAVVGLMPEDSLHFLAVVAHTLYEGIAYAIEHLLIHHLGTSKFQAQMLVFYLSIAAGLGTAYLVLRRVPLWLAGLRDFAIAEQQRIAIELKAAWLSLPNRHKFALLAANAVGIAGSMMVLLA